MTADPVHATSTAHKRVLWACVAPALVLPGIGAFCYFVLFAGQPIGKLIFTGTKIWTLTWPLIAVLGIERAKLHPSGWFHGRHIRAVPLGVLSGGVIGIAIAGLYFYTPLGDIVRQRAPEIRDQTYRVGLASWFIPFALLWSLVHSLLEEYYWRFYCYGRLRRLIPDGWAHLIAALGFGFHHYIILWVYFPTWWVWPLFGTGVVIGGAIWSWHYRRQNSLMGAWVSHAIVDLVAILWIGYLLVFTTRL